jgi:hypothetical protein
MRIPTLILLAACAGAADAWDRLAEISRKPAEQARTELEKLLGDEPGFAAARFNLGTLLLDTDPSKAAEQLELAAKEPAVAANAAYNLAIARFKQGRLEEALVAAERAVALDPQAGALRDEIRRVVLARQDEARRKAEEEARKLHLDPVPLPVGRVGEAYTAKLPIAGGTPPARAVVAGSTKLPEGISLAADGTLSGTPRTAGTTKLEVELSDAAGAKVNAASELRILPRPEITTAHLPEAILGQTYRAQLAAVGFTGPQRWQIATLPAGLNGSADGVISGTPTATGTFTVNAQVGDGTVSANRLIELIVSDGFAPAEDPLPAATVSTPYQQRLTVRGPTQEYRWGMPSTHGLQVTPEGMLSGSPEQAGDQVLNAVISAADGRRRETTLLLPVNPLPLIASDPITLRAGSPADHALKVTGGTPPYAWSIQGGVLPAGVRLDPDGRLRGVAKDPGTSTVTVAVSDRWKASTQAEIEIKVEPPSEEPPKKDEQAKNEDQEEQKQDEQQKQDGQQQTKKDDAKPGEQQDGEQKQDDQTQQQAAKEEAAKEQAAQAAALNQTAADRWLDQLPDERRDTLRYQLLDGGDKAPAQRGRSW